MISTRTIRGMLAILTTFVSFFYLQASFFGQERIQTAGAQGVAQSEAQNRPCQIIVKSEVKGASNTDSNASKLKVTLSGRESCVATFELKPGVFDSGIGGIFNQKDDFWGYEDSVSLDINVATISHRLLLLAESVKEENLKSKGQDTQSFLARAERVKVVSSLLEIVTTNIPKFSERVGQSGEDLQKRFHEVWCILWEAMEGLAVEAGEYPRGDNKEESVKVQSLLFKTSDGEKEPVCVFVQLMRSRAALFGGEVSVYRKADGFKKEYSDVIESETPRAEALARLVKIVYNTYRLPISIKSELQDPYIVAGKQAYQNEADTEFSLQDLALFLKYIATSPDVNSFLCDSKKSAIIETDDNENSPKKGVSIKVAEIIRQKANLLYKYLQARKTIANEEEMLKVIRYIYEIRQDSKNAPSRDNDSLAEKNRNNGLLDDETMEAIKKAGETLRFLEENEQGGNVLMWSALMRSNAQRRVLKRLLNNETIKNLYEAAKGEKGVDGIWDAEVYLRYLFLLSSYERGGSRIVGTDAAFDPANYSDEAQRILRAESVEDRLRLDKEKDGKNKLESDWYDCFGDDFGTFGRKQGLGEVLPPAPHGLSRVRIQDADQHPNLVEYLEIANDIPDNTEVQVVSKLIDASVNILYYKSFTRLLERYYQPASATGTTFNFDLY